MEKHRANPAVRVLPRAHGPAGLRARELTTAWAGRARRTQGSHRRLRYVAGRDEFQGPAGLRKVLMSRRDEFVDRSREAADVCAGTRAGILRSTAVRRSAREAAKDDYQFSADHMAVVESIPFQMRRTPDRMIITKKALDRRTFLRGLGRRWPCRCSMRCSRVRCYPQYAAAGAQSFGFVYVPNGIIMDDWTPATEGAGFEFTPTLKPLEPFRDAAGAHRAGADNGRRSATVPAIMRARARRSDRRASEEDRRRRHPAGLSADQIAAREIGKKTQLASLELGLEKRLVRQLRFRL